MDPNKIVLRKAGKEMKNNSITLVEYEIKTTTKFVTLTMSHKLPGGVFM